MAPECAAWQLNGAGQCPERIWGADRLSCILASQLWCKFAEFVSQAQLLQIRIRTDGRGKICGRLDMDLEGRPEMGYGHEG